MPKADQAVNWLAGGLLLAGIGLCGLFIPRDQSGLLLLAYSLSFWGYYKLSKSELTWKKILILGITARLLLFVGMPNLSDDIYRFLWDGLLIGHGYNPYLHLPTSIPLNEIPGIDQILFNQLNSPNYYTIYTPLNQALFWVATEVSNSQLGRTNFLRLVLLICELGSVFIWFRLNSSNKSNTQLAWFFLNPLIILEGVGNLHFEVMIIYLLFLGMLALSQQRPVRAGIGFGLAASLKLVPLIFLPAILFSKKLPISSIIIGVAMVIFGASLTPLIQSWEGIWSSIGLYFQKFEFNASIYFLIREIGFWWVGYNIIGSLGPALSVVTFLSIILISALGAKRKWPLAKTLLFALTIYLLLATTVHPWYVLPLIPMGLLCGYNFPIIWSFTIFWTYLGYTTTGYEPSALWIVGEYIAVVVALIVDFKNEKLETH